MNNGYWEKLARINLTDYKISVKELSEKICREYLGGSGLAAKIIADEVDHDVEPLSPENKIIFAAGPMNITKIAGAGRWTVASISPQSRMWGESNGGGIFGSKIKKTGFDGFIIEGKAQSPVYIVIEDGNIKIEDASEIWGKDSIAATEILENKLGKGFSIVAIGQAGEEKVPIACIISDKAHGHAGRTGMGAVLGSKNVKAIAVKGYMDCGVADGGKVESLVTTIREKMLNSEFLPDFREFGQPGSLIPRASMGVISIKNWMIGDWTEGVNKLGTPLYNKILNIRHRACAYCPMACKRYARVSDNDKYDHEGPGPEFETIAMLGPMLLIDDLKAISYANDLCNRFGIDTMSTGGIIAMVFELYEKGIINRSTIDGIKAEWGNADAMIELVKKIGTCSGIGKELGKGVAHLAKLFGPESEEAAVEVRGIEVPAHDPRSFYSMAVTYATSPRGACHLHGFSEAMELGMTIPEVGLNESADRFTEYIKGKAAAVFQDLGALHNSMVFCTVIPWADIDYSIQVNIINTITGWELTPLEFIKIGERSSNLKQLINLKRGLTREQMKFPKRFQSALKEGGAAGKVPDFDLMMKEYLKYRNWNSNAVPSQSKLEELDLSDYINYLGN